MKIRMSLCVGSVLAATAFSTAVMASEFRNSRSGLCKSLFVSIGKTQQELDAITIHDGNALLALAKKGGVTDRNFLTSKYEVTPELQSYLALHGIIRWNLRIYIAKSKAAAAEHAAKEEDPLMQGLYLIDPDLNQNVLIKKQASSIFQRLAKANPIYTFRGGKETVEIPYSFFRDQLNFSELTWSLSDPEHGPFIAASGWVLPNTRGVVMREDVVDSSTYLDMRRLARKLIREGFEVTFNKDFRASLQFVADQKRRVAGQWVANSRYQDAGLRADTMNKFDKGGAFSVEIWGPEFINAEGKPGRKLVGGLIGNKEGGLYSPDSVFYDQENFPKITIGFSKVAMVALMDRVSAAGIFFLDAGMVSHFTASMKGKIISLEEFLAMIRELPVDPKVDLVKSWDPAEGALAGTVQPRHKPKAAISTR